MELATHVDREGYKHIETTVDQYSSIDELYEDHSISMIIDFDQRVDEGGFEFFHIKAL